MMTPSERQEFDTLKQRVKALEDSQGLLLCLGETVGIDTSKFVTQPEPMAQLLDFPVTPKRVAGSAATRALPPAAPRRASTSGRAS